MYDLVKELMKSHQSLGTRVYSYPFCGFTADRDVNEVKNILHRALDENNGMDRPSRSPS